MKKRSRIAAVIMIFVLVFAAGSCQKSNSKSDDLFNLTVLLLLTAQGRITVTNNSLLPHTISVISGSTCSGGATLQSSTIAAGSSALFVLAQNVPFFIQSDAVCTTAALIFRVPGILAACTVTTPNTITCSQF